MESCPRAEAAVPVPLALIACGLPTPLLVTVIVAARAPVAAGAKDMLIVQDAPAASVVQPELVTGNSVGALLTMLWIVTLAPPVLVTARLLGELVVPTVCEPKTTVAGIVNWPGPTAGLPVPVAAIVFGLPMASLAIVMVLLRVPVPLGLNVVVTVQVAPGASVAHVVVIGNSATLLLVTLDTVTLVVPVLVTTASFELPVVPTVALPRSTAAGTVRCVVPVPLASSVRPPDPLLGLSVIDDVRKPVLKGVNPTLNVHDAPLAIVAPQVEPLMGNSPGLLLPEETPVASAVPLFVTVTRMLDAAVPMYVLGNTTGDGVAWRLGPRGGRTVTRKFVPREAVQVNDNETPSVPASSGCTT
jgi:hypothetical protein